MENMFGTKVVTLDDLIRRNDAGITVCKVCGGEFKALYATDKGYVCKEHR
jgi:predicted HNH restriction endonuclease